jgi:hypothetical protein
LNRIDYADSFLLQGVPTRALTAEGWAREVLEHAPLATRLSLLAGWRTLGLKVGMDGAPRAVCGWELRYSSPDVARLAADSLIGMPGELLFMRESTALLFATLIEQRSAPSRIAWSATEARHQVVVKRLLEQAAQRVERAITDPEPQPASTRAAATGR